jgi:hypothetical protein
MKQTMTTSQIADALRADDNADWSYAGARALAEYLEQYEEDTGEDMEFDRVAIRCEFSEYANATEAAGNYDFEPDEDADEDEAEAAALKFLNDRTMVIEFSGGIIIQDY